MAKGSISVSTVVGLALLVIGVGLAIWGYQMSQSLGSQITEALTGAEQDKVMMLYIGGAVSFIIGLYLAARR